MVASSWLPTAVCIRKFKYIKICESTDELNMSNNTIGIGQAYTMFTDDDDEVIRVKRLYINTNS